MCTLKFCMVIKLDVRNIFCRVNHERWSARDLFAVDLLVNWVELYRYWRRRQQRSSWLESSPISRMVQSRSQYSQRIHGTVHRGTWTDSGSSATILAADILEPCLYNINVHSFIYSLTTYSRRRHIWSINKNEKLLWVRRDYNYRFKYVLAIFCYHHRSRRWRHRIYVAESLRHGVETCPKKKSIFIILDLLNYIYFCYRTILVINIRICIPNVCNFKCQTVVPLVKNLPVVNVHKITTVYAHVNGDMQKMTPLKVKESWIVGAGLDGIILLEEQIGIDSRLMGLIEDFSA